VVPLSFLGTSAATRTTLKGHLVYVCVRSEGPAVVDLPTKNVLMDSDAYEDDTLQPLLEDGGGSTWGGGQRSGACEPLVSPPSWRAGQVQTLAGCYRQFVLQTSRSRRVTDGTAVCPDNQPTASSSVGQPVAAAQTRGALSLFVPTRSALAPIL